MLMLVKYRNTKNDTFGYYECHACGPINNAIDEAVEIFEAEHKDCSVVYVYEMVASF